MEGERKEGRKCNMCDGKKTRHKIGTYQVPGTLYVASDRWCYVRARSRSVYNSSTTCVVATANKGS